MNIAAVVILYNPGNSAIANIRTYYDYVDKVYVFDNTEGGAIIKESLHELLKVEYHHDFENQGIAKRLNTVCEKAIGEQFDWLLTMDQDTRFSEPAISYYFSCFKKFEGKERVGLFGTNFSRTFFESSKECNATEVIKLITSGSLVNLSLFARIGRFDEALFIDAVDYDYCFRAQDAGYSVVQFSNIFILHEVGKEVFRSSIKSFFLIKKTKEIHSPLRCYYMYRNMLYLENKYKNLDNKYFTQIKEYVYSRISVCILYGRDTWTIIKYLKAARKDVKENKMGKIGWK